MTSVFFYPHIGGIETVTEYLAYEFVRQGHNVIVVTTTMEKGNKQFPFKVLRNPGFKELWTVYKKSDVFVHQGISLKWIWPLFFKRKPWFVVYHQVYYQLGIKGFLKKICSFFSYNITVSETTKKGYGLKEATVILNSYNESNYKKINNQKRQNFVYVGKVSKAKGLYVLLDAFEKFKRNTCCNWNLTIVGDGEKEVYKYAATLSSYDSIDFVGFKYPHDVVKILNNHAVQIVPSLDMEAFGVVALEGMACGCLVIGSDGDGISEAMGKAGFSFHKGSSDSLCSVMEKTCKLSSKDIAQEQKLMNENIERLSLEKVAKKYLDVFKKNL